MEDLKRRKFDVFLEDILLTHLSDSDYDEWYDDLDQKELYRPFVLFGKYRTKEKKLRMFKIFKQWVEWK